MRTVGSLEDDLGVFLGELAWEGCSVQVVTLCVLVQWLGCSKHYSERVLQPTFSLLCETVGAGLGPKALLTFSVEVKFH